MRGTVDADDVEDGGIAPDDSGGARIARSWERDAPAAASWSRRPRSDLVKAERKLEAARERVSVTAEHLSATQSLRMARLGVLHACQAAHDAVERVRKEAEKAEVLARSDAAEADQLARQATQAVEPSRKEMERARDRFLNRPLLAYDLDATRQADLQHTDRALST